MSSSRPDALLLDLDDTILCYGAVADGLWEELAARFVGELPGLGLAELEGALARSRSDYWSDPERSRRGRLDLLAARRAIVEAAFHALERPEREVAQRLADAFTEEREERVAPFPGAIETLRAARDAGVPMALLTNGTGRFQRRKLARFGLAPFFETILIEGELGFGKPDPRVFSRALAALARGPEAVWMVGDNLEADIRGAQQVGIHAVWVDVAGRGHGPAAPVQPDRVVGALAELRGLF